MTTTERNEGGPAFPESPQDYNGNVARPGMTLRDYFAAQSLGGIMLMVSNGSHSTWPRKGAEGIAVTAYELADAMLKARQA